MKWEMGVGGWGRVRRGEGRGRVKFPTLTQWPLSYNAVHHHRPDARAVALRQRRFHATQNGLHQLRNVADHTNSAHFLHDTCYSGELPVPVKKSLTSGFFHL